MLGFVVFFGGFIAWSRFDAAGLPANEAVARVPRNDLVAMGASFLVPAFLAAFAAVAVAVVFWDLFVGNARRRRAAGAVAELQAAETEVTRLETDRKALVDAFEAAAERVAGFDAALEDLPEGASYSQVRLERDEAAGRYRHTMQDLEAHDHKLAHARGTAERAVAELAGVDTPGRREKWRLLAVGALPMLLAEGIVIAFAVGSVRWYHVLLLLGVAALTVAIAVAVVSMTNFAWYAVCVFIGVGVVIAASTYLRTERSPKVSPVVALDGGEPVTGYFVAETGDSVYVAQPKIATGPVRGLDEEAITMSRLPRATVKFLTVGSLKGEEAAYRHSLELAIDLCERLAKRRAEKPRETPAATVCHKLSVAGLETTLTSLPPR